VPSHRLPDRPARLPVPALAVFGKYVQKTWVLHAAFATWANIDLSVALVNEGNETSYGEEVPVFDMAPPMGFNRIGAHVVGWVGNLSDDEASLLWHSIGVAQGYVTHSPAGPDSPNPDYIMHPPYQQVPAEEPGRTRWRFSCAGLVIWCFEGAGIRLIDWTNLAMPVVTDHEMVRFLRMCRMVDSSRLPADRGQWRVVNAGYLLHSLERPDDIIRKVPYLPSSQVEIAFPKPSPGPKRLCAERLPAPPPA
jgi:hypothetical protein